MASMKRLVAQTHRSQPLISSLACLQLVVGFNSDSSEEVDSMLQPVLVELKKREEEGSAGRDAAGGTGRVGVKQGGFPR